MELRIGVHVGPVFAGVVGVKFPRYTLFGTTVRLTKALNQSTLPMTIHLSEMAYHRVKVRELGWGLVWQTWPETSLGHLKYDPCIRTGYLNLRL